MKPRVLVVDDKENMRRLLAQVLGEAYEVATAKDGHEALAQLAAGSFDVVLSSAVLHFARDDRQFDAMVGEMWRVLKPGGLLFARLASNIGMESRMQRIEGRRCLLPDGSERYLVDEAFLVDLTHRLGGRLLDPLKTTVVQDQRCMTTWVVRKTS